METAQVKYYYDVVEQKQRSFHYSKKNEQNDWQLLDKHK